MTMMPPRHFEYEMTMLMTPDINEKKWLRHDDLAITINDNVYVRFIEE